MGFFDFLRGPRKGVEQSARAPLFDEEFLRKLSTLALVSRRAVAGRSRGERRGKKRGSGVEFADHRPYVPGDDIRFLDVASYQKFGKLLLRLYEEEEDRSLFLLLDASASMGFAEGVKFDRARQLTAALAAVGLSGLDRVSVIALRGRESTQLPPTRGKLRIFRVIRFLNQLRASGVTDLRAGLSFFVARTKRRGVAILITDLFDPSGFQAGIDVLRFSRFEPCVIQIRDRKDAEPDLWGDVRAVDVESETAEELTVTREVLENVQKAEEELTSRASRYCTSRGVPFFAVDVSESVEDVVLHVLRRGGLLT